MSLTPEEIARYERHLTLAGFGREAQERLKSASVLVVGAGGLGCPALLYLAAAGVGRIVILDDDRVDVSNLQRQVLFRTEDAGQPKAEVAARRLAELNPLIRLEARCERLTRANAIERVSDVDVVVDGSDNFPTRYLLNDACVLAGRPFVYGAIQGFEGQVSVFNLGEGPTYRCLFPEPPEPGTVPNCAEAGVLGVLPGVIGTVQATEAIKVLTGIGEPLSGRLWLWDALTQRSRLLALTAQPGSRDLTDLPPEGYGETCDLPDDEEWDVAEVRAWLEREPDVQLIDVREDWERARGAIQPSIHVPLRLLEGPAATPQLASLDAGKTTVVYCAVGVRSRRGAELLRERHGFKRAVNLRGGLRAWHEA